MRVLTQSPKRARAWHVGLLRWENFVYPELYVATTARPWRRRVAGALITALLPVLLPYFYLQLLVYRSRFPEYRDR